MKRIVHHAANIVATCFAVPFLAVAAVGFAVFGLGALVIDWSES